jgi:hypothetical protein
MERNPTFNPTFIFYKRREQGTLNWEQIRNTHLHQFRASVKKRMFLKDA